MKYRIIPMNFKKHSHSVSGMLKENFNNYTEERFQWFFQEHPDGLPKTFLAQKEDTGEIVGSGSLRQRHFHFDKSKILAGIAVDFNIKKKYRVFGPATMLQKAITEDVNNQEIDLIFCTPNTAAKGVFSKIGYNELGMSKKYSKVLKYRDKLDKTFKIPVIPKILSIILDASSSLLDTIKCLAHEKDYDFDILTQCDQRFDDLWERSKTTEYLKGERKSPYLNWRFFSYKDNQAFCITDKKDKRLNGYIIFNIKNNIATILDLFTIDEKKIVPLLVMKFSLFLRKEHDAIAIQINYLGCNSLTRHLKQSMFIERPEEGRLCMLFTGEKIQKDLNKKICNSSNWYLFNDDMDI